MNASAATSDIDVRRLALLGPGGRVDLVAPVHENLADALAALSLTWDPERHAVITRTGNEVAPDTLVGELDDGTLLTVVDLTAPPPPRRRGAASGIPTEARHPGLWWMLGTASGLIATGSLLAVAQEALTLTVTSQVALSGGLGLAALLCAALWVRRAPSPADERAAALLSPGLLAFSAGVIATPDVHQRFHLAISFGIAAAALVAYATAVFARARGLRSIALTAGGCLTALTAIWALTAVLDWTTTSAAALSFALILPVIKGVPATVLNVPEGYHIEYASLMSSRWTVRGSVPESAGDVTMDVVRPYVDESAARVAVATVIASITGVGTAFALLDVLHGEHRLLSLAASVALIGTVIALLLQPRRASARGLRWVPRAAASVIAIVIAGSTALHAGAGLRVAVAVAALMLGIVAFAAAVPIGRGTSSLAWSRVGDAIEAIAVTLVPPAAVLAGGTLELVRAMVS